MGHDLHITRAYGIDDIQGGEGFILSTIIEGDDGDREQIAVIPADDENPLEELRGVVKLLWAVIDYFGYFGSKHDKYRLRVSIDGEEELDA